MSKVRWVTWEHLASLTTKIKVEQPKHTLCDGYLSGDYGSRYRRRCPDVSPLKYERGGRDRIKRGSLAFLPPLDDAHSHETSPLALRGRPIGIREINHRPDERAATGCPVPSAGYGAKPSLPALISLPVEESTLNALPNALLPTNRIGSSDPNLNQRP